MNQGVVTLKNGTVRLGGTFNAASLGNFDATGSFVFIKGTLNNVGQVLELSPTRGKWHLQGGTIQGGTITSSGGAKLGLTNGGGKLTGGVTIASGVAIDGTQLVDYNPGQLTVTGGLTLHGEMFVGSQTSTTNRATVTFLDTQTLSGTGTIFLGQSQNNFVYSTSNGSTSVLTIGPGITMRGGSGSVKGQRTSNQTNDSVVNLGTILASSGHTIEFGGKASINQGLIAAGTGTIKLVGVSVTNNAGGLITGRSASNFVTTGVTVINNGGIIDLTAPSIYNVQLKPTRITFTFDTASGMNASTVTNPANYVLIGSGGDGLFDNGNDENFGHLISQTDYDASTRTATLTLSSPLPTDFFRIGINGSAILDTAGNPLLAGANEIVNRQLVDLVTQVTLSLDAASDTGASSTDRITNDTTPTFRVQVNQPGTIGIDFTGSGTNTASLFAPESGTYSLTAVELPAGAYTAAFVAFSPLSGELGQASLSYTIDTTGPRITSMSPSGNLSQSVNHLTVTFSEPIHAATFTAATITLVGPGGTIPVNAPFHLGGNSYRFSFASQSQAGEYTLTIANTVKDIAGNLMDQNQNGVNGDPGDAFVSSFKLDYPDLTVTTASAPSVGQLGGAVPISWEVKNLSETAATSQVWRDGVYLSTDSVLGAGDVLIAGWFAGSTPLQPLSSYTKNQTLNLPSNVTLGSYFLLFVANYDAEQIETSTSNNVYAVPITLTAPDLEVTEVVGPTEGFTGQKVLLRWTLKNSGNQTATGPWIDRIYVSSNAEGTDPTAIASFTFIGSLEAGVTVERIQEIVLPPLAGTLWFVVKTNAFQAFAEPNTANNTLVSAQSIDVLAVPLPDLVTTVVTPPANNSLAGSLVPITYTVQNVGPAPTSVPKWTDWVILSQDPTIGDSYLGQLNWTGPEGDEILSRQPVVVGFENPSYLAPGESYQQTVYVRLPRDAQGTWYVYVVPNGTGARHPFAMPEESRTNNLRRSSGFSVILGPVPDLEVVEVQAPIAQNYMTGRPIRVRWTVSNQGTGATEVNSWVDAVYASKNATFDDSAILLGKFVRSGSLEVNASYSRDVSVQLPPNLPLDENGTGLYYFHVRTDVNRRVFETLNSGGSDYYLGTAARVNPLSSGSSYTLTGSFPLPASLTAGNYYVFVATDRPISIPGRPSNDGTNLVYESNEGNNVTVTSVTTSIPDPPARDLTVSNVTIPATATSGWDVPVSWTVTNTGTPTGNVSITDSIYLSYDRVFDPQTDVLLGSVTRGANLSDGGSYNANHDFTLKAGLAGTFYVIVRTNANRFVLEINTTNNIFISARPVMIELAPLTDLVAGVVTIPENALAGQEITLTYRVTNQGGNTATGRWIDSLYLSPTPTWTYGDPLLGRVAQNRTLTVGSHYEDTLTAPVPGIAPGTYYVVLRTNVQNSVPEQTRSNNLSASVTRISIDAQTLLLDEAKTAQLAQGRSAFYKVAVPAGETLRVTLTSNTPSADNELYVSFGTMPTRGDYEYRYSAPFQANQEIVVPTTREGYYYIQIYADQVAIAGQQVTIEANLVPFSIRSVSPGQAGAGPVTIQFNGARFDNGTVFHLRRPDGTVLDATRILLRDSATAFATFDLTGQPLMSYDAWAIRSNGASAELASAVTVEAAKPNSIHVNLLASRCDLRGPSRHSDSDLLQSG